MPRKPKTRGRGRLSKSMADMEAAYKDAQVFTNWSPPPGDYILELTEHENLKKKDDKTGQTYEVDIIRILIQSAMPTDSNVDPNNLVGRKMSFTLSQHPNAIGRTARMSKAISMALNNGEECGSFQEALELIVESCDGTLIGATKSINKGVMCRDGKRRDLENWNFDTLPEQENPEEDEENDDSVEPDDDDDNGDEEAEDEEDDSDDDDDDDDEVEDEEEED